MNESLDKRWMICYQMQSSIFTYQKEKHNFPFPDFPAGKSIIRTSTIILFTDI